MQIIISNGVHKYFMPHELEDTVDLMCSESFIERMVAEYFQLRIRIWNINKHIEKEYMKKEYISISNTLTSQRMYMIDYSKMLERRLNELGYKVEDYGCEI